MRRILLLLLFIGGCSSTDQKQNSSAEGTEYRVRPSSKSGASAAYFTYTNSLDVADTLLSVESTVAGMTQVHESFEIDGMVGMREVKDLIIPPGEQIIFKQGGLHIMLMALNRSLTEGDSISVVLNFSEAGSVTKKIPVHP